MTDDLAVRLAAVEKTLAEHDAALSAPGAGGTGDAAVELAYPDLASFVEEFLALMFPRPLGGEFRWCPWWWDHGEAVLRLESLWRAFESLRLDGEFGVATWLRDHFDHQWPRLLSPTGPFARCSPDRVSRPHEPDPVLRVVPPPDGWPNNPSDD